MGDKCIFLMSQLTATFCIQPTHHLRAKVIYTLMQLIAQSHKHHFSTAAKTTGRTHNCLLDVVHSCCTLKHMEHRLAFLQCDILWRFLKRHYESRNLLQSTMGCCRTVLYIPTHFQSPAAMIVTVSFLCVKTDTQFISVDPCLTATL